MSNYVRDLFSGDQAIQVPLNYETPTGRFVHDVVAWARETAGVHTSVMPEHALGVTAGIASFGGHLMTSNAWARPAYVSFSAVCFGVLAWLTGEGRRAFALEWLGLAAMGVSIVLGGAAFVMWRRARIPVQVRIFPTEKRIGARSLRTLVQRDALGDGRAWVVARGGFTSAGLQFASSIGLRCIVLESGGFTATATEPTPHHPLAA